MFKPQDYYTFNEGRKCLHCGAKIPDQAHATTRFCPWEQLPDGTIKSCKDDYHALRYKDKNLPFQEMVNYHKATSKNIEKLLSEKGETVTAEYLNQYYIDLTMPVKYTISTDQKFTFYFVNFCLTQITSSTFKITKHENNFGQPGGIK